MSDALVQLQRLSVCQRLMYGWSVPPHCRWLGAFHSRCIRDLSQSTLWRRIILRMLLLHRSLLPSARRTLQVEEFYLHHHHHHHHHCLICVGVCLLRSIVSIPDSIPGAGHLSRYVASHPGQLSLAIPSWVGKWVPASAGKAKAGIWFIPLADERGVCR